MAVLTATPLPTSPTRGEVPGGASGTFVRHTQTFTSPLMGEVGRGWSRAHPADQDDRNA